MPEFLRQIIDQIQNFWKSFSAIQKVILSSAIAIVFLVLIVVGIWSTKSEFVVLYSKLTREDSSAIVDQLKTMDIEYKLATEGKTILVPQKDVYEIRLKMAGEGLPKGGTVGFEIFDKTGFGVTAFRQKVDYLRALQGELERTITRFDEVEMARVHLVLPDDKLFVEDQKSPTASVIVGLKPGVSLVFDQIKSIANLVARSVEGLETKNITIVDNNMNVLSDILDKMRDRDKMPTEMTLAQQKVRKGMEQYLKRQVETMLYKVLGPNRSVSRVFAELNFDKKEIMKEVYHPVVDGKGIARSTEETEEYYQGTGTLPGGIPGTSSNIPSYQAKEEERTKSDYEKRHVVTNYEISKDVVSTKFAPGEIKRLSVSVFVDQLKDDKVKMVEEVVAAAIGFNRQRGDQIVVRSLAFDRSLKAEMEKRAELAALRGRKEMMYALGVLSIFSLLILVGLLIAFKRAKKKDPLVDFKPMQEDELVEKLVSTEKPEDVLTQEDKLEAITGLAKQNPNEFSLLLKSWLVTGRD